MLKFLKNILQLVLSPANGWEDISHSGDEPSKLLSNGYYPLIVIASLTTFVAFFLNSDVEFAATLQEAIAVFVEYFVAYFLAINILPLLLSSCVDGAVNERKTATFIIYSLSLLALITIIQNAIAIEIAVTMFLPLIMPVVMWKGARYLAVNNEKMGNFIVFSILIVFLPPLLMEYLFHLLVTPAV